MKKQEIKKTSERKMSIAHQQNLVEMFGYIYLNPNKHNVYTLAHEMSKSRRTILRMIDDINAFCPYIIRSLNENDGCVYYSIKERFSETDLDSFFKKSNVAPVLYIFLTFLLIKPLTVKEVMQKLGISQKKATLLINQILDASYIIDFRPKSNEMLYGNYYKFLSKLDNQNRFEEIIGGLRYGI